MKKRILSGMLLLALLLTMLPATVWATDDSGAKVLAVWTKSNGSVENITTRNEFVTAFSQGGTFDLKADVDLSLTDEEITAYTKNSAKTVFFGHQPLAVPDNTTVTLNLHGHNITADAYYYSYSDRTWKISGGNNSKTDFLYLIQNEGILTINGKSEGESSAGTIRFISTYADSNYAVWNDTTGTLTMNNVNVESTSRSVYTIGKVESILNCNLHSTKSYALRVGDNQNAVITSIKGGSIISDESDALYYYASKNKQGYIGTIDGVTITAIGSEKAINISASNTTEIQNVATYSGWNIGKITNCTITAQNGYGIYMNGAAVAEISNCTITGASAGVYVNTDNKYAGIGNFQDNTVFATSENGYALNFSATGAKQYYKLVGGRYTSPTLQNNTPVYIEDTRYTTVDIGDQVWTKVTEGTYTLTKIDNSTDHIVVTDPDTAVDSTTSCAVPETTDAIDSAGYAMAVQISGGTTDFNVGDTITVNIVATATSVSTINSYGFTLDYDTAQLTLTDVRSTLTGSFTAHRGIVGYNTESGVAVSTGTTIATATFTVNSGIKSGNATISLKDTEMTTKTYGSSATPTTTGVTVNLHNIQVTLNADAHSTINGGDSLTLYAKYNVAGLYSNETYTDAAGDVTVKANIGYCLNANNWTNGSAVYKNFDEINALAFTDDATFTLQTAQTWMVTIVNGGNGTLSSMDALTIDNGATLTGLPTPTAEKGYIFDGWYVGETEINTATYAVTENITLTARFAASTYDYSTELQNVEISNLTGVTDGQATYGTAITFTATATGQNVLNTVSYTINGGNAEILTAVNGVYTIPGTAILGKVTILADTTQYYTVTFEAGDGTTLTETKAYGKSGAAGLYATLDALKADTADTFTVPEVTAQEGYRMPETGESLWWNGEDSFTASEVASIATTQNITLTAKAIKTYTVTFAADSNGVLTEDAMASVTVDTGTKKTDVALPATVPSAGYTDAGWTWNAAGDTITSNITATASFTDNSYKVTLPSVANVTMTTTGTTKAENGDIVATHNTKVTFTINVGTGVKVTTVKYKIGDGNEIEALSNTNGIQTGATFEINGSDITGAISVTLDSNATYQITFQAGDNGTVNGEKSVTKTFDVNYVITTDDLPTVAGDTGYEKDKWDTDPAGQTVTGNQTYTVSFKKGTYTITWPEGMSGDTAATYDTDLVFTPTAAGKIIYNVSAKIGETPIAVTKNDTGVYTIAGTDITGDITITVDAVDATMAYISFNHYKALAANTKIAIFKTAKRTDHQKYALRGYSVYWSDKYQGYVAIVATGETDVTLAAKLSVIDGTVAEIPYDGDINHSGSTSPADSGMISDILDTAAGTLHYTVDDLMRLKLDVTGDGSVTVDDIVWILEAYVGIDHSTNA